jgi:hypothetical protein
MFQFFQKEQKGTCPTTQNNRDQQAGKMRQKQIEAAGDYLSSWII